MKNRLSISEYSVYIFLFCSFSLFFVCTSCGREGLIDQPIIESLQSIYEEQMSMDLASDGCHYLASHGLELGQIEPFWGVARETRSGILNRDDSESEHILPVKTEYQLVFSDLSGNIFDTSYSLLIRGERCWIIIDVSSLRKNKDYHADLFSGMRIFLTLSGHLYKVERWRRGSTVDTFYFQENILTNQFQCSLLDHIFHGLRISKVRGSFFSEILTRSDPDTLDPSYCYGLYEPNDWNNPDWWNEWYFQFIQDSLVWDDFIDTVDVVEDYAEDEIGGGFGGGGGGGGGGNSNSSNPPANNSDTSGFHPAPTDLSDLIGTDQYYLQRFSDYLARYGADADTTIYYKSYGDLYYNRFMNLMVEGCLTNEGNIWVVNAARLLQEKLEAILQSNPRIEDDVEELRRRAFLSHISAYTQAGFLELPLSDKIEIALTIDFDDLCSQEGLLQVRTMGVIQLRYYVSHPSALLSDARYLQQNWSTIFSDIYHYLNGTRSVMDEDVYDLIDLLLGQQIQYYYENVPGFQLPYY